MKQANISGCPTTSATVATATDGLGFDPFQDIASDIFEVPASRTAAFRNAESKLRECLEERRLFNRTHEQVESFQSAAHNLTLDELAALQEGEEAYRQHISQFQPTLESRAIRAANSVSQTFNQGKTKARGFFSKIGSAANTVCKAAGRLLDTEIPLPHLKPAYALYAFSAVALALSPHLADKALVQKAEAHNYSKRPPRVCTLSAKELAAYRIPISLPKESLPERQASPPKPVQIPPVRHLEYKAPSQISTAPFKHARPRVPSSTASYEFPAYVRQGRSFPWDIRVQGKDGHSWDIVTGKRGPRPSGYHNAIDVGAPAGTPVYFVPFLPGERAVVTNIVRHGEARSSPNLGIRNAGSIVEYESAVGGKHVTRRLFHCQINPNLKVGQTLTPGTQLGTVWYYGRTRRNDGERGVAPHVHYEIYVGDRNTPLSVLEETVLVPEIARIQREGTTRLASNLPSQDSAYSPQSLQLAGGF